MEGVRSLHLSFSEGLAPKMWGQSHLPVLMYICSVGIQHLPQNVEHFNLSFFVLERASI